MTHIIFTAKESKNHAGWLCRDGKPRCVGEGSSNYQDLNRLALVGMALRGIFGVSVVVGAFYIE